MINVAGRCTTWVAYRMSILVCVERPRKRTARRTVPDEPVTVQLGANACRIADISRRGCSSSAARCAGQKEQRGSALSSEHSAISTPTCVGKEADHGKTLRRGVRPHPNSTYRRLLKGQRPKQGLHENEKKTRDLGIRFGKKRTHKTPASAAVMPGGGAA